MEGSGELTHSSSHPNMDLIDTNHMPNLKSAMEEISKEPRRPRPLSRSFDVLNIRSKQRLYQSKEDIGNKEHVHESPHIRVVPLKHNDEQPAPLILSPEKKSYKERTVEFFQSFKGKKSRDVEHEGEEGKKDSYSSMKINLKSTSIDSMNSLASETNELLASKEMVQSPSSHDLKDITGYESSKIALINESMANYIGYRSSRMTMTVQAENGLSNTLASHTTYNAMSNFRQSRMSGMFGSNSNNKETEKANAAQNLKTFKEYYRTLVEEHDNNRRLTMAINRRPRVLNLSALFGIRGESTDPMNRLMWMSSYHQEIKSDPAYVERVKEASQVSTSRKPEQGRILDVDLESNPIEIELEKSELLGLDLVTAGTEKALLDRLMIPIDQDLSYPEIFLASYRFFISPIEVLNSLTEWYNLTAQGSKIPNAKAIVEENEKLVKVRSLRIILLWIRNHWQDFLDNQELWCLMRNFSKYLSNESFPDFQKVMHAIREERLSWMTSQYIPMFPSIQERNTASFWCPEVDTKKFAHNLTMLDHIFFRQMRPDIYLQILSKPGQILSGAYNLSLKTIFDYCNWFRMVASYPSSLLAIQENTKKRTMTIRLLIKIANTCLDLGNLQSSFAIIYGLKLPSSLIWYSAWEALPAKSMECFKAINNLMSCKESYKLYWDYTQKMQPPAVPFLIPYIHDLVFLFENTSLLVDPSAKPEDTAFNESLLKNDEIAMKKENIEGAEKFRVIEKKDSVKGPSGSKSIHEEKGTEIIGFNVQESGADSVERESKVKGKAEKKINFQKFYDIFSIVAELESEKNGACELLQHIRFVSKRDDASIGTEVSFNSGSLPDDNPVLNSEAAIKNLKKIVNLLAEANLD